MSQDLTEQYPAEAFVPRGKGNQVTVQGDPIPKCLEDPLNATKLKSESTNSTSGADLSKKFIEMFKKKDQWASIYPTPAPSQRRALVIAISYGNRYPPARLPGTYVDAYRIIQMLENTFGYRRSEICILADVSVYEDDQDLDSKQDKSRSPSKCKIVEGLNWLVHGSQDGDYRFLFCILPEDIDYLQTNGESPSSKGGAAGMLIPNPRKILWDHKFNEILATSLGDGSKLTVIFDCCHSGGTLSKADPNANDQSQNGNARHGGAQGIPILRGIQDLSNEPVMSGNILDLPFEEDIEARSAQDVDADSTQPRTRLSDFQNQGRKPSIDDVARQSRSFHPKCRIICWAACANIQFAFEHGSPKFGGIFCTAFTDHLKDTKSNYRLLNRHIDGVLRTYNDQRKENARFKKNGKGTNWDDYPDHAKYQHAKLFTSANMGDGTGVNQFELPVDI